VGVCRPDAVDRCTRRAAERELGLGPAAEVAPRVRPRPRRGRRVCERASVRRERPSAGGRQTAVGLPQPLERDGEIAASAAALELRARVPLAKPHCDAVREAELDGAPPRAVGADRAHRPLRRFAGCVVGARDVHVPSVPVHVSHVGHEVSRNCAVGDSVRDRRTPARPQPRPGRWGAAIGYMEIVTKPCRPRCCGDHPQAATLRP
jgi:hypothetical protein